MQAVIPTGGGGGGALLWQPPFPGHIFNEKVMRET